STPLRCTCSISTPAQAFTTSAAGYGEGKQSLGKELLEDEIPITVRGTGRRTGLRSRSVWRRQQQQRQQHRERQRGRHRFAVDDGDLGRRGAGVLPGRDRRLQEEVPERQRQVHVRWRQP